MKHNSILLFAFLVVFFSANSGDTYSQSVKPPEQSTATPIKTDTKITKDILKERMAKKGIKAVPNPSAGRIVRPNPLTLQLKFSDGTDGKKLYLNSDPYKSSDELVKALLTIFKEREDNGVFRAGTNEVEKEILLKANDADIAFYNSNNIYVEDFERLVDDLRKAGIDQLKLDLNEPNNMILTMPGNDHKAKPKKPIYPKKH